MKGDKRKVLLKRLDRIERLTKGSHLSRFLHSPLRYLFAISFWRIFYPLRKKGKMVRTKTFFGSPMNLILPSATEIFLFGTKTHESEIRLTRFLLKNLDDRQVFADIGAHFGYFSLLAAHLVGKKGGVYAIEPSRSSFDILLQNTSSVENIKPHNFAASNVFETLLFYEFPALYSEYNSLILPEESDAKWLRKNPPRRIEVKAQRIDDFFRTENVVPDVVKIDVEGAELKVLRGMENLLKEQTPTVVMEFIQGSGPHMEALLFARSLGYSWFQIKAGGGLMPCPDPVLALQELGLNSDNLVLLKT